jgi:hypothetical protein
MDMTIQKYCTLLVMIAAAHAAGAETFKVDQPSPVSELWINPGMYSYHFQKDKGLNNSNFGFGAEYRYSTVSSITAGFFRNSVRRTSHYVGWYWQPLAVGKVRLGAGVGGIDGYPGIHNGGWFPAVIPTASIEFSRVGMNLIFIPSYKDQLYGALSMQVKIRVY